MTKAPPSADDIAEMNFEEAMRELERIVQRLEGGQVDLEESIAIYERGAQLRKHCEGKLKDAETRVRRIVADADGKAVGAEAANFG